MVSKSRRCRPRDFAAISALVVSGSLIAFVLTHLTVVSEESQAVQSFAGTFAGPVSQFQQYFDVRILGLRATADALSLFGPVTDHRVTQTVRTALFATRNCGVFSLYFILSYGMSHSVSAFTRFLRSVTLLIRDC